ncbi:MAG TPA: hypothetical protein VK475_07835, partial [Pyrinomonadaceae bacterium]|nr:hypothetical protein [Pyrinomonadaceae bacterium]
MLKVKQYPKPNTAVRPPVQSPEWLTPPSRSRGLRHFPFASKASSRSITIVDNACVESESGGERRAMLVISARPDTLRVIEQSPVAHG